MSNWRVSQIDVPSGKSSRYRFILKRMGTYTQIDVYHTSEKSDDDFDGHLYHTYSDAERGVTALTNLIEQYHEYKKFFEAMQKLAITSMRNHRLEGFLERHEAEDDQEDAYGHVATMIEEAERKEERRDEERN